ncbi:hypothetical protein F4805DRAFT_474659 [Annulohypoxylon moriforme]|nr:hypothetical protein F4805DRAFT_474659 [Annulohypoxylon moriforme]
MSEEKSYYSEEGPALVSARIKTFFDKALHYKWGGELGAGANGVVYKITRYADGKLKTLAVKVPPIDVDLGGNKSYDENDEDEMPDEVQSIIREKDWLQRLRNGFHIIKSLDLPNDPLARTPEGVSPHRMRSWIFMEYAENGGLRTFIERHVEQYEGEILPSRLLWRFFMCLVRGCLEMAYYNASINGQRVDFKTASIEDLSGIEPGGLAHQDLGSHNVVIGAMTPDANVEHNITPILKLIDFGEAGQIDPERDFFNRTGSQVNVGEISQVMSFLILQDDTAYNGAIDVVINGRMFETHASSLRANQNDLIRAGLDIDLLNLVYRGLSMDKDERPGLIELARIVHERVLHRGHRGAERETDQSIKERIFKLIHHGDTEPPKRHRDSDEDSDDNSEEKRRKRIKEDK